MTEDNKIKIIFESLIDDSAETLRDVRSAMLAELEWDIDHAQDILNNLPYTVADTDDKDEAKRISQVLSKAGAVLNVINLKEDSDSFFYELNTEQHTSEPSIDSVSILNKDLATSIEIEDKAIDEVTETDQNIIDEDLSITLSTESSEETPLIEDAAKKQKEKSQKKDLEEEQKVDELTKKRRKRATTLLNPDNLKPGISQIKNYDKKLLKTTRVEHENFAIQNPSIDNSDKEALVDHTAKNIRNNTIIGVTIACSVSIFSYLAFVTEEVDPFNNIQSQVNTIRLNEKNKTIKSEDIYTATLFKKVKILDLELNIEAAIIGNKVTNVNVTISPDNKPKPKLKEEEIINSVTKVRLEKMIMGSPKITTEKNGKFLAEGQLKIFLDKGGEKHRPVAEALLKGRYDSERRTLNFLLLVNSGYKNLPEKSEYKLDPDDPRDFKLYIKRWVVIEN